jgi:hypothetical protein
MITTPKLLSMFAYWFKTPVNSIFGSSFGCDHSQLFLRPEDAPIADEFLNKLRRDMPVFGLLSPEQLTIEVEKEGFDVVMIYLRIMGVLVELGRPKTTSNRPLTAFSGEMFDVNAQ